MAKIEDTRIYGDQYAAWREVGEKPTPASWQGNKTCPQPGERRWTHTSGVVGAPRYNRRFWQLYKPASSCFNGCAEHSHEEHSHELDLWALIECEAVDHMQREWKRGKKGRMRPIFPEAEPVTPEMAARGEDFALQPDAEHEGWVEVLCHRIVPLADIPLHFPPSHYDELPISLPSVGGARYVDVVETERLKFTIHSHDEACEWWVSTKTPQRLVLYSFEVGREDFQICNAILPLSKPE